MAWVLDTYRAIFGGINLPERFNYLFRKFVSRLSRVALGGLHNYPIKYKYKYKTLTIIIKTIQAGE